MKLNSAKPIRLFLPSKFKPASAAAAAVLPAGSAVTPEVRPPTTRLQRSALAPRDPLKLMVVGGIHDLETGNVRFFEA